MGHRSVGYENIPNWAEVPSKTELREAEKPSNYFEGTSGMERKDVDLEDDSDASSQGDDSDDSDVVTTATTATTWLMRLRATREPAPAATTIVTVRKVMTLTRQKMSSPCRARPKQSPANEKRWQPSSRKELLFPARL